MEIASDLLLSLFDLTFTVWWRHGGLLAWTVRPHAFAAADGLCHDLGAGPSTLLLLTLLTLLTLLLPQIHSATCLHCFNV